MAPILLVPGKLFQPDLMFVGKDRSLPKCGAPENFIFFLTKEWAPKVLCFITHGYAGLFVTVSHFQLSLIFPGKARSLPLELRPILGVYTILAFIY
jgi:hypothetical protein